MTREERENALHCLKVMIDEEVCEECKLYGSTGTDHCEADCVRVAIKALEQEPILDKIRAEIESKIETIIGRYDSATPLYDMASYKIERNKVREECIEIIDKYRQEG